MGEKGLGLGLGLGFRVGCHPTTGGCHPTTNVGVTATHAAATATHAAHAATGAEGGGGGRGGGGGGGGGLTPVQLGRAGAEGERGGRADLAGLRATGGADEGCGGPLVGDGTGLCTLAPPGPPPQRNRSTHLHMWTAATSLQRGGQVAWGA